MTYRPEVISFAVGMPANELFPSEALEAELIAHVRNRLSPHVAPRTVAFIDAIPMTATGKIKRRELRSRELDERA